MRGERRGEEKINPKQPRERTGFKSALIFKTNISILRTILRIIENNFESLSGSHLSLI